jgi:regulatory protein
MAKNKRTGPVTAEELDGKALRYLDRFDSSAKNLRRVLATYVRRAAAERGAAAVTDSTAQIEALLTRYQASGLLDDARFAGALAAGLRRRGASSRAVVQKLRFRGVDTEIATQALKGLDAEAGVDAELQAARAFVRRRRIGPHRPEAERAQKRHKDLGALARAGFSMDVARRALGGTGNEDDGAW